MFPAATLDSWKELSTKKLDKVDGSGMSKWEASGHPVLFTVESVGCSFRITITCVLGLEQALDVEICGPSKPLWFASISCATEVLDSSFGVFWMDLSSVNRKACGTESLVNTIRQTVRWQIRIHSFYSQVDIKRSLSYVPPK